MKETKNNIFKRMPLKHVLTLPILKPSIPDKEEFKEEDILGEGTFTEDQGSSLQLLDTPIPQENIVKVIPQKQKTYDFNLQEIFKTEKPKDKVSWKGLKSYNKNIDRVKVNNVDIIPFDKWKELPGKLNPIYINEKDAVPFKGKPKLRQENVMNTLNQIQINELKKSTRKGKKGTQLPELKDQAKQLDISITNQKKNVIAQKIYDKIEHLK